MAILNNAEITEAQNLINQKSAGLYRVPDIYGDLWKTKTPTSFGKKFRATERDGLLTGITFNSIDSENDTWYEIS